jgi:hypothetical protein
MQEALNCAEIALDSIAVWGTLLEFCPPLPHLKWLSLKSSPASKEIFFNEN